MSEGNGCLERIVMWRDASFLRKPGCATRYHLPREGSHGRFGHPVALCDRRIDLLEDNACTVEEAGPLFCRRCDAMTPNG